MDRLLEATERAERDHCWFHGFRAFVTPLLDRALAGHAAPAILDCGCGTGNNLARLLRPRGRAVGVDLAWRGLQFASQRPERLPLAQATVARLPFGDRQFDVVTSFDVLQCVADDEEPTAFAEMFRVLRPGGHAVINVSALPLLHGGHSVLTHEVRRYTRGRLRRLVQDAGFEVRRLTYTFATLLPLIAAVRFLHRVEGLPASDQDQDATREIDVPPRPINAMLTWLVRAEARAARTINPPIGSSLLCLARRPGVARDH